MYIYVIRNCVKALVYTELVIILRSKSLQVSSLYNLGSERSGAGPRVVNREERLRDETKRLPGVGGH